MIHTKFHSIWLVALASLILSSCDDFFEKDISDKEIQVISPYDGAELSSNQLSMGWSEMEGASTYHLIIVSPTFEKAESYVCDTILTSYLFETELPNGDYEWSVQAKNSEYASLINYQSFKIAADEE